MRARGVQPTAHRLFTGLFTGRARLAAIEAKLATLSERTPAALRVEVDELRAEVEALRASNRKEFGKLWRRLRDAPEADGSLTGDPKLDAILAAQTRGPIQPKPQ